MDSSTDQITQAIADYFRPKMEIAAVYLFGSYAGGRPRLDSDLDLGLLFERSERGFISEMVRSFYLPELARMLRKDIDLVPLNHASERLLSQVFLKGQCIQVNHPKHLALFKMTAFSNIAEFGPLKAEFEKSFTRKVMRS